MRGLLIDPKPVGHVLWQQLYLTSAALWIAGFLFVSQSLAHGTHARFLAPQAGEVVTKIVEVHVDNAPKAFPYIHLVVRQQLALMTAPIGKKKNGEEIWSGLVPLGDEGYFQEIDVSDWKPGPYAIEAKFVGDFVEHTNTRVFVVSGENTQ